jgi:DNA invertase Pin-like site-specific DNA recombinase
MPATVYARYSSENQRPESIDDQISACRKLAKQRSIVIADDHIYSDQAQSGARSDRPALAALMAAARSAEFDAVMVDDLSRLARDNHLMLSLRNVASSSARRHSGIGPSQSERCGWTRRGVHGRTVTRWRSSRRKQP